MSAVITILFLMSAFWLLSILKHDAGVIDTAWGLGFVLVAWVYWYLSYQDASGSVKHILLPFLVSLWGGRLSLHLFLRNRGKPEDYRYRQMREHHGDSFWWISLFTVFGLQGLIMYLVSLPLQFGVSPQATETFITSILNITLQFAGIALWIIGMLFETVGDWQLTQFRSRPDNKGKVLQHGLWRYTRHPNYFGDCLVWWSFFLLAVANGAPWWTIVSPLLMTFLLVRISGVALLEKSLSDTKPGYQDYTNRTSAFLPWLPKKAN